MSEPVQVKVVNLVQLEKDLCALLTESTKKAFGLASKKENYRSVRSHDKKYYSYELDGFARRSRSLFLTPSIKARIGFFKNCVRQTHNSLPYHNTVDKELVYYLTQVVEWNDICEVNPYFNWFRVKEITGIDISKEKLIQVIEEAAMNAKLTGNEIDDSTKESFDILDSIVKTAQDDLKDAVTLVSKSDEVMGKLTELANQ
jgi:hypothetical protein